MKRWMISAAVLWAAAVSPAGAQDRSGFFAMTGHGARGWTVSCSLTRSSGEARTVQLRGRRDGDRQVIARRRVSGGACTYQAAAEGQFVLEFNDADFACPFTEAQGLCRRTVPAGAAGSVELQFQD